MTAPLTHALEDRYRIDRAVGAGGMATVYLAHDVRHDRKVALKVLRPELSAVIGADRFLAEIKTTANLQHPHILALYDSGQVDGTVFYVMPYVEGESLRDRLSREKQLPIDDALRITREVASALDYAHRHGVIHRDIKPENILLHDGQAIVADFGIALAASRVSDTRMTETGMSLGTPTYMSPEQAMGERSLDARTDVYALGCVLFEMLAGEPPFTGPTAQAIVAKVLTEEPRSLATLRRSVPAHVDDAVQGALEKLPADRVASAREFAALLEGNATAAPRTRSMRHPAAATRGARPISAHPLVIALAATVLALGSLVVWQWRNRGRVARPDVTRFLLQLPADTRLAMYSLIGPSVTFSPDGRRIVFIAEGADGSRRLYLRTLSEIDARVIPATEGASQPTFSPDGRWIAYLAGGRLMRISVDGGNGRAIASASDIAGFTWRGNAELILGGDAGRGGPLLAASVDGGSMRPLTVMDTAAGETLQQYPVALADGRHVLYSSWGTGGTETARIGVVWLSTGASRPLDVRGVTPLGMVDHHIIYATTNNDILATPVDLESGRVTGETITVASGVMMGAGGVAKAALSASGSLAYLGGERASQMVLVGLDGGSTPVLQEQRTYGYPRFSPDGKRIAMTIGSGPTGDVWIYDFSSRTPTRLTSGGSVNERPEWTPDGQRVLFRSDRGTISSIWWQRADQSEQARPLLSESRNAFFEAVISPDGKHIVYQIDTSGANVEYRALQGDTTSRIIASTPALEYSARVSPDGKWVAYVTDESGSRQVVVQPFPGPGPRVQVSTAGGAEPVWTHDGKRIIYRGSGKFVAANVVMSPTFSVTSRTDLMDDVFQQAVSPHANFDISPDGKRLLVLKGVDAQRLFVVSNWAEEVRARMSRRPTP